MARKDKKIKGQISEEELGTVKLDFDFADSEDDEEELVDYVASEDQKYSNKVFLRLKMAMDRVKQYYSDFRNEMNKYDKISFRSTSTGDTYLYKRKVILKVSIFARALKIYMNLNSKDFDEKYHLVDMSDIKKYESTPLMIRVGSDRSYKYLLEIFESLINKYRLPLKKVQPEVIDYVSELQSNTQEILGLLGYQEVVTKVATLKAIDMMPNNVAKNCQVLVTNPFKAKGSKVICEVTVGELSAAFKDKYQINLQLLIDVGIASADANYLRIIGKGDCRYPLDIQANDYDINALKLIIMTGGNVVKYV